MKVMHVKTEYLQDPLGIDITSPRIRWNVAECTRQTAYEIAYQVHGVSYTTGKVVSSSTFYDFTEVFQSRDQVLFTVTAYEDEQSATSEVHFFELGLLCRNDWKAHWITGDYCPNKKTRYPVDYFKKDFAISTIRQARLYISALGLYEAHINNQRVGRFVLAPGSTDYSKRVQYQTYDVTSFIKEGANILTVALADGWYRGSIGARGKTCVFGDTTALIVQLEIMDYHGKIHLVNSDESWSWSNDGPILFADLKDGEHVDMHHVPSFSQQARVLKTNANLTSGNNNHIEAQEIFTPIKKSISKTGRKVFEFKHNVAGYISLKYRSRDGALVKVTMGELLDEDGNVTLKNIQLLNKKKKTPLQEVRILSKEGLNEYHATFFIAGFRYLDIDGEVEVDIQDIQQIALYTTIEETGSFSCSNELVNTFFRNTLRSLKNNSADVPTDCPTRERMGWTGDSQLFFETASFLTDYAAFTRKHLVDVFDRQSKNGKLPQIAPYNAEDWYMNAMNGSVGWADVGVLTPYRFYKKYGDIRILVDYYDRMNQYAHFMIKRCGAAKGIYALYAKPLHLSKEHKRFGVNTGQSYGEWAEPNDVKPFVWTDFAEPHAEESMAYTFFILDIMIEISQLVGKTKDIALFKKYRDGVQSAYQELVTKPRFSLDTNRQAKLVRPLYMKLLTEEQQKYAEGRLITALEAYRWRLGTGFLSTPFILRVLSNIHPEHAYRLLENEEMPGWLYMAKNDTGTIWEGWEGPHSQQGISSLNHYSKGAMVEWLFNGMCGIHVIGDNQFLIKPVIGGTLTFAKATYHSVYGMISSSWEKKDGKIVFEISVPANTTAMLEYKDVAKKLSFGQHRIEF